MKATIAPHASWSLIKAGLVDRLRLMVFPQILVETGRKPVFAGLPDLDLERFGTKVLNGRLVTLQYRPATAGQGVSCE